MGLALLIATGVCAIAFPSSAKRVLLGLGFEAKGINVFGISLVQASTFNVADTLVEAQMSVDNALPLAENLPKTDKKEFESSLRRAKEKLTLAQSQLDKQDKAINDTRSKSGFSAEILPDSGWIYVGLLDSDGQYKIGSAPRLDASGSVVNNGQATKITLKYDAPVYETVGCEIIAMADLQLPLADSTSVLIRAMPPLELPVLDTKTCPMQSNWKQLYARIRVPADRVRIVKISEWK